MISQKIFFNDLEDNQVSETFWFKLSKIEIVELGLDLPGGLEAYIDKLSETNDGPTAYKLIKELTWLAVGERHEDGRRFIKNPDITTKFTQSEAYSEHAFDLFQDVNKLVKFIKGILPKDLADKIDDSGKEIHPDYSSDQLMAMTDDEFRRVAGGDEKKMSKKHLAVAYRRKASALSG